MAGWLAGEEVVGKADLKGATPHFSPAPRRCWRRGERAPGLHRAVPGQPHLRQVPSRERLGLQPALLLRQV